MEKKTLRAVMAALLMAAVPAFAGTYTVTADQAKAMVRAWSAENKGGFGLDGAAVVAARPFADKSGAVLWYAVTLDDGSCVFTAADTRIEPVIAVVPNCDGTLPAAHPLRALLEADLRGRLAAVSGATGASLQSVGPASDKLAQVVKAARAKWARYASGAALQDVPASVATPNGNPPLTYAYLPGFCTANESLLFLTHWNQTYEKTSYDEKNSTWPLTSVQAPLYNYYTPKHYVCGCVATAGATILQYFGAPEGKSNVTNVCTVNGEPVKLATIGGTYDWSILPKNMGGQAANCDLLSREQRELLGRVTYDVGVGVKMGYTQGESGAYGHDLPVAFKELFGFQTAVNVKIPNDMFAALTGGPLQKPADFVKPIYNQLRCGAPVALSITGAGGHEVLAVGYGQDGDKTDYTRVFMGWSGRSDAWYQLPDITDNFKLVQDVTTMLSVDGACVPICGQIRTADGEGAVGVGVSVPGVIDVLTGANGLFGFRLTAAQAAVVKQAGKIQVKVGENVYDVDVEMGDDYATDPADTPAPIDFEIPADVAVVPTCISPVEAVEQALHSNPKRLVCMLAGRDGDAATEAVKAYLAAHAESFNAKFAFYYADAETDGWYLGRSVPSFAVFNPSSFDPARGWNVDNGRLAFVTAEGGAGPMAAQLQDVLDKGWDCWTRLDQGVRLTVRGGTEVVDRAAAAKALEKMAQLYADSYGMIIPEDILGAGVSANILLHQYSEYRLVQALRVLSDDVAWRKESVAADVQEALDQCIADAEELSEGLDPVEDMETIAALEVLVEAIGELKGDPDAKKIAALAETVEELAQEVEGAELLIQDLQDAAEAVKPLADLEKAQLAPLLETKNLKIDTGALGARFPAAPAAGTYEQVYVGGTTISATNALEYVDNRELKDGGGVIWRCTGWKLEADGEEIASTNVLTAVDGELCGMPQQVVVAEFALDRPDLTLTWLFTPAFFRIRTTSATQVGALLGETTPGVVWINPGARVDLMATPASANGYMGVFQAWDEPADKISLELADGRKNNCGIQVEAYGARDFVAYYTKASAYANGTGTVTVRVSPAEIASQVPATRFGTQVLPYGQAVSVPAGPVACAPEKMTFVDANGMQWVCTGWRNATGMAGVPTYGWGSMVSFALGKGGAAAIEWVWEAVGPVTPDIQTSYAIEWTNGLDNLSQTYETNLISSADLAAAGKTLADLEVSAPKGFKATLSEVGGNVVASLELDEEALRPAAGSSLTIEPQADGSVVVQGTVVNGVKGFWYALYSAEEVMGPWKLVAAGEYLPDGGSPVEQARADQEVQVKISVQPESASRFYKLKVTDVDPATIN